MHTYIHTYLSTDRVIHLNEKLNTVQTALDEMRFEMVPEWKSESETTSVMSFFNVKFEKRPTSTDRFEKRITSNISDSDLQETYIDHT